MFVYMPEILFRIEFFPKKNIESGVFSVCPNQRQRYYFEYYFLSLYASLLFLVCFEQE